MYSSKPVPSTGQTANSFSEWFRWFGNRILRKSEALTSPFAFPNPDFSRLPLAGYVKINRTARIREINALSDAGLHRRTASSLWNGSLVEQQVVWGRGTGSLGKGAGKRGIGERNAREDEVTK